MRNYVQNDKCRDFVADPEFLSVLLRDYVRVYVHMRM